MVPLLHLPAAAGAVLVLCTQLLEPLYTTHIQKQLTEQADAIVQKLDDAIADGQTLSYWGFGSQLYVNSQFSTSSAARSTKTAA